MLPRFTTAASFVPSSDEVMECQSCVGPTEVSSIQVAPESDESQMLPPFTTAASFVPSSDEVMERQDCVAPTEVSSIQVAPEFDESKMLPPAEADARMARARHIISRPGLDVASTERALAGSTRRGVIAHDPGRLTGRR